MSSWPRQCIKCPAPQRKMKRANNTNSVTTRFVARLVTQGNLRKPTNICMRIEKHEIAMIRSDAIIIMMNTSAAIGEGRMHVIETVRVCVNYNEKPMSLAIRSYRSLVEGELEL